MLLHIKEKLLCEACWEKTHELKVILQVLKTQIKASPLCLIKTRIFFEKLLLAACCNKILTACQPTNQT